MKPYIFHLSSCIPRDESLTPLGQSKENSDMRYISYLFGRTHDTNESICVITEDYVPYFYIGVPPDIESEVYKDIMLNVVDKHISFLVGKTGNYERDYMNSLARDKCSIVTRRNNRGFSKGKKIKLLRIAFKNEKMMKLCGYYLNKQKNRINVLNRHKIYLPQSFVKMKIYDELKFDNLHKMCHIRNVNPAGWGIIKKYNLITGNAKRTKQDIEIVCSYLNLEDLPRDNPYHIDIDKIPPFVELSYDGEMYSCDGLVPQFQRDTDCIIQIGTIFRRFGENQSFKKVIVTQKHCGELHTPNVIVIECKDETDLIKKWAKVIEKINPDIIYGYNTFGFDDEYFYQRAKKLGCEQYLLRTLSRCINWPAIYRNKELTSSGLGQNVLKFLEIPGRINIDIMLEIRKNVAFKFPSYRLDYVSKIFIGDKKDDLSPHDLFAKYKKGDPNDIAIISDYCIKDCELVHNLVDKLAIIPSNVGMARVCHVVIDYIISRGQGIKILSLLAHFIMQAPLKERFILEYDANVPKKKVGGAIVLFPKIGIYNKNPVVVIDFNSLYPSIMIALNLSHDTMLLDPRYKDNDNKFNNLHYYDKDTSEKKFVEFLAYNSDRSNMGLLPRLLETLLSSRKVKKGKMALVADHIAIIKKCMTNITKTNANMLFGKLYEDIDGKLETNIGDLKIEFLSDDTVNNVLTYKNTKMQFSKEVFDPKKINTFNLHYNGMITKVPIKDYKEILNALILQQSVLNALQMADKITCNSVYGQTSAPTSALYLPEIGSVVTTMGQHYIQLSKKHAEEKYGADCIYGDSVTGDTPLLIKYPNNSIDIKTIETLSKDWKPYNNFKLGEPDRKDKQQANVDLKVWSKGQWADIHRVIRHKTNKKLYRVNTYKGCVDVTEDHSLIDVNGNKVKPGTCKVGDELMHSFPDKFSEINMDVPSVGKPQQFEDTYHKCIKCNELRHFMDYYYNKKQGYRQGKCKLCIKEKQCEQRGIKFNGKLDRKIPNIHTKEYTITKEEAWCWGLFFGDGSCGSYRCLSGKKDSWAINNQDLDRLNKAKKYLEAAEPDIMTFKILDTIDSSGVYKLVPVGSLKYMVDKYRPLFYDHEKYKKVPKLILNAPKEIREWFLKGYYETDGCKTREYSLSKRNISFCCKGKIGAQGLYYICKSLGFDNLSINLQKDKDNIYFIRTYKSEANYNKIKTINQLTDVTNSQYVYDIETSSGLFQGGVGELIEKNTDSVFIEFPIEIPNANNMTPSELKIAKLLEAKRLGYQISEEITNLIGLYPMKIAYEKGILPLILMGKKNYCGLWHEEDVYKSKFKMMGCKAKKREYAPIVNKLFTSIVNKIVYADDYESALENAVRDFYKKCKVLHKYPHKYFVITKSVKRDYKVIPMQKILANRIAERDLANAPKPNSRLGYIFIDPGDPLKIPIEKLGSTAKKKKAKGSTAIHKDDILKGHRIETPTYIEKNNIPIDFEEYIVTQIAVPIISVLRLEIPLNVIEYLISDVLGGKNVNVRIKQNKRIIYTTGEEEITESAKISVLKSNKNQKQYVFRQSDLKYVKFIESYKRDIKSGRVQIING